MACKTLSVPAAAVSCRHEGRRRVCVQCVHRVLPSMHWRPAPAAPPAALAPPRSCLLAGLLVASQARTRLHDFIAALVCDRGAAKIGRAEEGRSS